jgi:hypothetical protein
MDDYKVWQDIPAFRRLYNKLDLSLRLGYNCGPAGCPVTKTTDYVIRPVINLSGMGATAYIQRIEKNTDHDVPPGYFWCEKFRGNHISINYSWRKGQLYPVDACQGWNNPEELYRFSRWQKLDKVPEFELPSWIHETMDAHHINIEFVGGHIIEIHGRHGLDFPKGATEIIPVWKDTEMEQHMMYNEMKEWIFKANFEDADGTLANPRLGFYYR